MPRRRNPPAPQIGGDWQRVTFTVAPGQTAFDLPLAPGTDRSGSDPLIRLEYLSAVPQLGTDYTVDASRVTWISAVPLEAGEQITVWYAPLGGDGGGWQREALTVAFDGQTDFVLLHTPGRDRSGGDPLLRVEYGAFVATDEDFTLDGNTVRWNGPPALAAGEQLVIWYVPE